MNNNYIGVDLDLFRQPKIQRLEVAHGKGAVAIYLQVYLKLAELGGKANIEDLALWEREFFIKKETLEEVIFFPDLFVVKDNFLHSKVVDAKLNRIKNKSEKARASANARWSKTSEISDTSSNADAMRTHNERNANKENKIKEKENKENDIKSNPLYEQQKHLFFPDQTDEEIDLHISTFTNDYPRSKPTSIFNFLKEKNQNKKKDKQKNVY